MKFVKIDTVIGDVIDWGSYKGMIDRVAMKKWANSVLNKLDAPNDYENKITLLNIKNHKLFLPDDLKYIVQVAYKHPTKKNVKLIDIVEWHDKSIDKECQLKVIKECENCDGSHIVYDIDERWRLAHLELKYQHMPHYRGWFGLRMDNPIVSQYHPDFVLAKASTKQFFNADLHIPGCVNLNNSLLNNVGVDYKLLNNDSILEFNKKEGQVLLSYLAVRLDENGYRLVPDIEEVFEAMRWQIIASIHFKAINTSFDGNERIHHRQMYALAESSRINAMGAANEILNTPNFEDWISFLKNNYFRVLKDQGFYEQIGVNTPDVYNKIMDRLTNHN